MTKDRIKWNDYERALIITHYRKFGRANVNALSEKIDRHSMQSVKCELNRFADWQMSGIMEFGCRYKDQNSRPGSKEKYIKIINDLSL